MGDIIRVKLIYDSPTSIIQGKMNRVKLKGAKIERVPLPLAMYQHRKDLQFYIDLCFVNGYPFLETKTNKVNFITAKPCIWRTTSLITKDIDTVLYLYESRGFNINFIHGDNEFKLKTLTSHLLPIFTHTYGKEYNVGITERVIRVIKEQERCMCHAIPYKYYTKLMIQSLI